MSPQLNPTLTNMRTYPFVALEAKKRAVAERGVEMIDFGAGDPREPTPAFVRDALVRALEVTSSYPKAAGLPELRAAIARWIDRRTGARVDPEREIVPTSGSKEAIFSFANVAVGRDARKDVVVVTEPGYPVPPAAARLAGARVVALPLRAANGFLPDLGELDARTWDDVALLWLNYPNNPTAATAPRAFLDDAARLAARHDFWLASDEAYGEIYVDEDDPPPSALQAEDRDVVVVFNTLSKRSSMTGYRSGFVAAPAPVVEALRLYRPLAGTASPEFVQRAAIEAWGDEKHVRATRAVYRAKRAVFEDFLPARGVRVAGGRATFYLWLEVPRGETSESFAGRLLDHGVVVAPGSFFGPAGEGYVRMALVPTLEACERACAVLEEVL